MTPRTWKGLALASGLFTLGLVGGYWLAQPHAAATPAPAANAKTERAVLYWYDPMYPQQKFDKPGKSPFMDMQLVPQYAGAAADSAVVSIDPRLTQNLGMRVAKVTRGSLPSTLDAVGVVEFNERDAAVVQARDAGVVERGYSRAPGDVLQANDAIADVLFPEWVADQQAFLSLKRTAAPHVVAAAREHLRLSGMPAMLIAEVERSGTPQPMLTVTSPIGGVLQELNVRPGMTVAAGDTLARITGLSSVWLAVAIPEAEAGAVAIGQSAEARLPALTGEVLRGTVSAVLPEANADSRTVRVRVELPNVDGRLRPGMTAQVRLSRPAEQSQLWVPSEAVIRTGRRALVMVAEDAGHYRPVEVQVGREQADQTVVLSGLTEGQQVVASGQFLLDSEASLKGIVAAPGSQP